MRVGLRQAQATEIVGSLSLSKRGGDVLWPSTGSGCDARWFAELVEALRDVWWPSTGSGYGDC